jgi:tRNA threonylcarbamoyl adenosine modification protein YeaZ
VLLALDTSTTHSSIALYDRGVLAEAAWLAGTDQTRQLLPRVRELLRAVGRSIEDVSSIGVATGPGSFNGLRVGITTAKAIAIAMNLPVAGVETLRVTAYAHRLTERHIRPLYDAGRSDVATGLYRESAELFATLEPPRIVTLDEALDDSPPDTLFCGELRPAWRERIVERFGSASPSRSLWPGPAGEPRRAGYLAELAWELVQAGLTDDPATLQPLYLRRPAVTTSARVSTGAAP